MTFIHPSDFTEELFCARHCVQRWKYGLGGRREKGGMRKRKGGTKKRKESKTGGGARRKKERRGRGGGRKGADIRRNSLAFR